MAGRLHVDEVLSELAATELMEWQAYYLLEPFGDDWKRTALLAMLIAETHRNPDERSESFTVEEFMPHLPIDEAESDDAAPIAEYDEPAGDEPWRVWKATFAMMADATKDGK